MSGLCPVSTFGSLLFFLCAMHEERRVLVRHTQGVEGKGVASGLDWMVHGVLGKSESGTFRLASFFSATAEPKKNSKPAFQTPGFNGFPIVP